MLDTTFASVAVRISTRLCLLCHSLSETEQPVVAVIGETSFEGYTEPFPYPNETKKILKWYRSARGAYASICSPKSCSPYCCRTSPHTAFLLHNDCIRTLQRASRSPLSKRTIWNFVRCMQPGYAGRESDVIGHQIRTFAASISSADLSTFPVKMVVLLKQIRNLPRELQRMILDFTGPCLGLSLVTVLLDTLPLLEKTHTLDSSSCQLKFYPNKMYVRYDTIRGQTYISEISNHWHTGMGEISCASQPDHVILSLDDLGIRNVCFSAKGFSSTPVQAPWYQHDQLGDADQPMLVTKNPFVVRQIAPLHRVAVRYLWDLPTVPTILEHQWYERDRIIARTDSLFYMRHVNVDHKLTGLTVACHMWTNMSLYAHRVNGDRRLSKLHVTEVERAYGNALVWLYFPMSLGERICGFWVLTMPGGLATVAIYTSHGRSRIFGPYHEPADRADITIHCLNCSQDGYVSTIFYNELRSKSTERDFRLAVSSTQDMIVEVPERPPWPTSAIPIICRHIGQSWYHSQAPLKGIRCINICKNDTKRVCFGMELHYHDHSTEVLGQWRFDQCIEELSNQDDACAIHFQVEFVNGIPCVKDIRLKPYSGPDQPGWVTMAMNGCLVWWFSRMGGVVVHEEDMIAQ
ncbi:hypothetical protein T440DRAFT_512196 [Plenodomus tracheiphilus IPT5]|uniref:Uncharacterized protein n=1 Tax=Plenodomus tracheiphilus IPT5 TaxID=1408161 RepID=A0A6A7AN14_9PLEO|nr:hypothetical protein T440DRAFT_512196 [Plenodomus tracheiphilus IPT5]